MNDKPIVSKREQLQLDIEKYLIDNSNRFSAPYGIICGLDNVKNGKGKVRTITFGVARYLDACIYIFSENNIVITGQGGLAYKVVGNYKSINEVMDKLKVL